MHYQLPLIKSSFTTLSLWAPSERVCNTAHAVYVSSLCHHEQKKRGCEIEEEANGGELKIRLSSWHCLADLTLPRTVFPAEIWGLEE